MPAGNSKVMGNTEIRYSCDFKWEKYPTEVYYEPFFVSAHKSNLVVFFLACLLIFSESYLREILIPGVASDVRETATKKALWR